MRSNRLKELGLLRMLQQLPFGKGVSQDELARDLGVIKAYLVCYMKFFPNELAVSSTGVQKRSKDPVKPKSLIFEGYLCLLMTIRCSDASWLILMMHANLVN